MKNINIIIASFFTFYVFFLCSPIQISAATESVRIIRQDCTGYTNCYTSLSAWEAGENRDLTATDEIAVARIEGTWTNPDTAALVINGWTTGPDNYIKIYTASEARHSGVWNAGKYRLETTDIDAFSIQEDYAKIDGLQIRVINPSAPRKEFFSYYNQNGEITLGNSIIHGSGSNSVGIGINSATTGSINL